MDVYKFKLISIPSALCPMNLEFLKGSSDHLSNTCFSIDVFIKSVSYEIS